MLFCAKNALKKLNGPSLLTIIFFSSEIFAKAQKNPLANIDDSAISEPFYLLFLLIGIALLPFIAIMTTSFAKIVVVLSVTRQALGTQQAPPNIVIISVAMLLTAFSMYPVFNTIYKDVDQDLIKSKDKSKVIDEVLRAATPPIMDFLSRHSKEENKDLFFSIINNANNDTAAHVSKEDLVILAPAFLISELTLAFQIGFLIYLPFLVIDMTVANILMALGMQMLAPTTISLPFKILLFVLVDGWRLIAQGLLKA